MKPDSTLRELVEPAPVADPSWPHVDVSQSPRAAAALIALAKSAGAIVTEAGVVVGLVSANRLLEVLSIDEDPTTRLPRSGPLRDWLSAQLRNGNEVSVVFCDLDNFGELNRLHGHTVGDAALGTVASRLSGLCDERDFCSRFGGDEFAIGSLRSRVAAEGLAIAAKSALEEAGHPASFGVSGGRRAGFRGESNVSATVEELLRLASVACMAQKQVKGREPF